MNWNASTTKRSYSVLKGLLLGVMFSVARSKSALLINLLFVTANTTGLVLGIIYHSQTPDLYEKNVHNKLGWIATLTTLVYVVLGLIKVYTTTDETKQPHAGQVYQRLHKLHVEDPYRYSRDSGHGTDTTLSRSSSISSLQYKDESDQQPAQSFVRASNQQNNIDEARSVGLLGINAVDRFLSRNLSCVATSRVSRYLNILHSLIDRTILVLGFVVLTTGIVTYGGIFVGTLSPLLTLLLTLISEIAMSSTG